MLMDTAGSIYHSSSDSGGIAFGRAVQEIRDAAAVYFPKNGPLVTEIAVHLRLPEVSLQDVFEELFALAMCDEKKDTHKLLGKIAQFVGANLPVLRDNMRIISGFDGTGGDPYLEYDISRAEREITPLPRYTGEDSIRLAVQKISSGIESGMVEYINAERLRLPKVYREQDAVFEIIFDNIKQVFGGMNEGAMHVGAVFAGQVSAHEGEYHRPAPEEVLRLRMRESLPSIRSLTELGKFEIKLLDGFVDAGLNPYGVSIQDGSAVIQVRQRYLDVAKEVIGLLGERLPKAEIRKRVVDIYRHRIGQDLQNWEQLVRAVAKIPEMAAEFGRLKAGSWQEALGCPATRAKVINEWYDLLTGLAIQYYIRETAPFGNHVRYAPV